MTSASIYFESKAQQVIYNVAPVFVAVPFVWCKTAQKQLDILYK